MVRRDGFRAVVFRRGGDVFSQSRDLQALDRYFPERHAVFLAGLPDGCVVDGEMRVAGFRCHKAGKNELVG